MPTEGNLPFFTLVSKPTLVSGRHCKAGRGFTRQTEKAKLLAGVTCLVFVGSMCKGTKRKGMYKNGTVFAGLTHLLTAKVNHCQ